MPSYPLAERPGLVAAVMSPVTEGSIPSIGFPVHSLTLDPDIPDTFISIVKKLHADDVTPDEVGPDLELGRHG